VRSSDTIASLHQRIANTAMTHTELTISTDHLAMDLDMIHAFLTEHTAWARGISRETVAQSLDGSLCFGGFVGAKQVAFARLVTDYATFGYLCDVFVLEPFRGQGYAKALMRAVFESPMTQKLRRIVLVTTDAHAVYRPFGFEPVAHPERYMELHRPDIYTSRDDQENPRMNESSV
jgi:GNAT superfamily N-acetyltransferase